MEDDLSFDWDQANISHVARHGVTPDEVAEAMANEAIDVDYEVVNGEQRWTSVGHSNRMRVLVVVWTMRADSVRPVTAFEAGKQLASDYLKQKGR
jgi:hypothetical protein